MYSSMNGATVVGTTRTLAVAPRTVNAGFATRRSGYGLSLSIPPAVSVNPAGCLCQSRRAGVAGCLPHPPASDNALPARLPLAETVSASLERGMDVVCGQTSFSFSSFRTHRSFAGLTSSPRSVARFGASPDGGGGSRRRFRAESRPTRFTAARSTRASALRATSRKRHESSVGAVRFELTTSRPPAGRANQAALRPVAPEP
jgi:hypothetical protein